MVIYLGQNVPLINLKNVFEIHKVDFMLTSIASNLPDEAISEIILELQHLYGDKKILIGGNCVLKSSVSLPDNFTTFKTLQDFTDFLELI